MAAATEKHVETENVMSFEDDEKPKRKFKKRKQPFVKISYDSGSDADAESDDDNTIKRVKKTRSQSAKQMESNEESGKENKDVDEADQESEEEDDDDDDEEVVITGAGWADAMSKILGNEAPEEGPIVLGKSKDYAKKKEQEEEHFMKIKAERDSHRHWENMNRVKPKVTEREHERDLQRTATKGVVQLFNAVKKQQKFLEDKLKEAGSETKRIQVEASISKGDFLDLLKGSKKSKKGRRGNKEKKAESEAAAAEANKPMWSVLREDFMMGAKMKDWDKNTEEEEKNVKDGKR